MTRRSSLELLAASYPNEAPLAGGAARIPGLDQEILDGLVAAIGTQQARKLGRRVLSADWIATERALHYVTPKAQSVVSFPWEQIREIRRGKLRRLSQTLTLQLVLEPSRTLDVEVGRSKGRGLTSVAQRFGVHLS
jgi:hypothetical protein